MSDVHVGLFHESFNSVLPVFSINTTSPKKASDRCDRAPIRSRKPNASKVLRFAHGLKKGAPNDLQGDHHFPNDNFLDK